MSRRLPQGPPPPPVVARVRLRYTKHGRLRFVSHRDFARAFERALRRADIPMAYSAGFSPHPKISYVGAAPTGVASQAEYLEIGLARAVPAEDVRHALDAALPDGLDVVDAVSVPVTGGTGSFAERMHASHWVLDVPDHAGLPRAVQDFLARDSVTVERLTKDGRRELDARAPVVWLRVSSGAGSGERAILDMVVRQVTPVVRPDDVLAALRAVGGPTLPEPVLATRVAQGPLGADGLIGDPLADDRGAASTSS